MTFDELIAAAEEFKLPIDVKMGAGTFRKGVGLSTLLKSMQRHGQYADNPLIEPRNAYERMFDRVIAAHDELVSKSRDGT